MFFWKMISRSLGRHKAKKAVLALTIMLGTSLCTSMLAVVLDVGDKVNDELGAFGANIEVKPAGTAAVSEIYDVSDSESVSAGSIEEDQLPLIKTIFWGYNIQDFTPLLPENIDGTPVVGTWFNQHLDLPTGESITTGMDKLREWWTIDGQWADQPDEAMVGARAANSLGVSPGDTLRLNGLAPLKVAGVFHSGAEEDRDIYADLKAVQRAAQREGQVGSVEVKALTTPDNELSQRAARDPSSLSVKEWETWYCTAYASSIAYQIEEALNNVSAKPVRQIADSQGSILDKTELIMMIIALFAMIGSCLGIANLLTSTVLERSAELGLMKSLGARNYQIVLMILTETLVVGVIGGLVGCGLGIGLAQLVGNVVFSASIAVRPMVLPIITGLVLATLLVGSLPAMRSILRVEPTRVLHGK